MGGVIFWLVVITTIWMTYDASDLKIPTHGDSYSLNTGALAWFVAAVILWFLTFPYYLVRRSSVLRQRQERGMIQTSPQIPTRVKLSDQEKDKLFGEMGIDLGFITASDVAEALTNQKVDETIGTKRPIGAYLLEAGKLNREQIARIIAFQEKFSPKHLQASGSASTLQLTVQASNPDSVWFYEENGQRKGGVSQEEIIGLISSGFLSHGSSVWQNGFPTWVTIENTALRVYLNSPPPLTGALVNNSIVWLLAFAPVIGKVLQYIIAQQSYGNSLTAHAAVRAGNYWYVTLILNIVLCVLDEIQLRKAGHNTEKFKGWLWLIPVYLYQRATSLNQGLSYFIAWIICFLCNFSITRG